MLKKITITLLLFGLTAFYACKDSLTDNPLANKAPTTKIFLNPDTTISQQQSKIKLYWSGDDPDGSVIGFYFSWDGQHWTFTTQNDSLFSLQIGAVDTIFSFRVSAVDNSGDGVYNSDVFVNGIHYGPEPFTDLNANGLRDANEPFQDIGLIDPNPAMLKLPIKNTAPSIVWNELSTHPDTSFTAMTFAWDPTDIDGNSTIQNINIALNDTNNFVSINGTVNVITIRTKDFSNANPLMDILINGDPTNQPYDLTTGQIIKLPGLIYNSDNTFYVQAVDISGAKSPWLSSATQKNSRPYWHVKKPKGKVVIVDNYSAYDDGAGSFYSSMMDSLSLNGKYDVYEMAQANQKYPFLTMTFLETIKLFPCTIWYTDNAPSLDLANATVNKYTNLGGKIFFSMLFPQDIDLFQIQGFLPIQADSSSYKTSISPNVIITDTSHLGYPTLTVASSFYRARAFYLSSGGVIPIYYFPDRSLSGYIGFENSSKNIFFIGMPLHKMNRTPGSVKNLLNKVLFQDFNITP